MSGIPALRNESKEWVLDATAKADLFVRTMSKKFQISAAKVNDYTVLETSGYPAQSRLPPLMEKAAEKVLSKLDQNSRTFPTW